MRFALLSIGNHNNGNNPARSTEAVTARSTGTAATPTFWTTTAPVTPFNVFLNTRGAQFTTPGLGLSQGPASGGPQGGLAGCSTIRPTAPSSAPSARRGCSLRWAATSLKLCSSYPAPMGRIPATVTGFGAVFTDVDQPDGSGPSKKRGNRGASTLIEYFGADGKVLFSSFVPASPGDASLSFFGIMFDERAYRAGADHDRRHRRRARMMMRIKTS